MTDEEKIAEFIRTRGVTRCPAAYGAPSDAVISEQDRAAHLARFDGKTYLDHKAAEFAEKISKRNTRERHKRRIQSALAWAGRKAKAKAKPK